MKNAPLNGLAVNASGAAASCLCTGHLRNGAVAALVPDRRVFAAVRPPQENRGATAAWQHTALRKYQEMTRIAAAGGGVSGSHPAWDPV